MALRLRRGTEAERSLITPASGEIIYTTDTKRLYVGDGTTVGGNAVSGKNNLSELDDVGTALVPPTDGQVLAWDGNLEQWLPANVQSGGVSGDGVVEGSNYKINIVGADSSLIVDAETNTLTGNFFGEINATGILDGDLTGSVFNDDSSIIVDSINGTIVTDRVVSNDLSVFPPDDIKDTVFTVQSNTPNSNVISLLRNGNVDLSADTVANGRLVFGRNDPLNGAVTTCNITGRNDALFFFQNSAGIPSDITKYIAWKDGNLGVGTVTPAEVLDVKGNALFSGTVEAASIKGTIVGDDSTVLVDAVNNTIPGYVSISELKTLTAGSLDFADFQAKIALL